MMKAAGKPDADFYLQSIALSIRNRNDQKMAEHGITNQQARLLGGISRSLHEGRDISRKALEGMMELKGPSVTSLLNGLEKKGFILRYTSKDDGRAMNIQVTEKGNQVLEAVRGIFDETQKQLLQGMEPAEQEQFLLLLSRAHKNLTTNSCEQCKKDTA